MASLAVANRPEEQGAYMIHSPIDHITWHDQHIDTIARRDYMPSETTFTSPDSYYQQLGFVIYPKEGVIVHHSHLPLQRYLVGTPERVLEEGDMIQLVAGGHCIKCLEDTIFLEIKQGPYTGLVEKGQF